ncbi:hypothetical protein DPMN_077955 [Dreissena polymorpha]|uniref:Uncharacterized protein n=1 Tax=Dreissena polymorpha TaxID=45954 RepID=A0A9D3YLU2_DREPO|nr:hypothetical protein DPMN_077955 [Dreissena polymorpha]
MKSEKNDREKRDREKAIVTGYHDAPDRTGLNEPGSPRPVSDRVHENMYAMQNRLRRL